MLVFAAIMPHPPESVSGIGTPEDFVLIKKTLQAFEQLRNDLEKADPETIVIISPHGHMETYSFVINSGAELEGSLSNFGAKKTYKYDSNIEIADNLSFACLMNEMPCELHLHSVDHGVIIPLYHLLKKNKSKIVHLSFSLMNYERHYRYGEIIQKIIDSYPERIAVIASGDLSHNLNINAPTVLSSEAEEFDQTIIHHLGANDLASIMSMDEAFAMDARECGMRSIIILLGILHGKPYEFKLLSYESPSGVGYLTARLL